MGLKVSSHTHLVCLIGFYKQITQSVVMHAYISSIYKLYCPMSCSSVKSVLLFAVQPPGTGTQSWPQWPATSPTLASGLPSLTKRISPTISGN